MADIGRPLKFGSVEELQEKIDDYFADMDKQKRPYTISGLALYLDTNRQTLLVYENKEKFSDTIKRAKERIENFAEEQLFTNKHTAGVIFNMVNNWNWKNKQENDTNLKASFSIKLPGDLNDTD